jgi:two-component system, response regulator PdtaR
MVCGLELDSGTSAVWHLQFPMSIADGKASAAGTADHPACAGGTEVSGMKTDDKAYSILITDDDPGSRSALREILEQEGYRTLLASSGAEAIEILHEEPVHLGLFDVHMPRMTGVEVVQIAHEINAVLPCILVTADANEEVIRQAFHVRAYSVIPKPVSRNILLYTMVRALMKVYGSLLREERE